ncbi:MAG: cupredoxin domain-containing protein, partial [bacterium]
SCWMGMVKGLFVVKEAQAATAVDEQSVSPTTCPLDEAGQSACPPTETIETVAGDNVDNISTEPVISDQQIVKMTLDGRGYRPDILYVKQGVPVKWIIDVDRVRGCTRDIILQGNYNIKKSLVAGQNIIEFTPQDIGEIPFSCGMEMIWGKFVVTAN